jgi:2-keto-3-deoxy-6-phosphogluconate aldolase
MTEIIRRPPLSDRLSSSKVIAVMRASHVSAFTPVCDVLVEEGILSLELTLTTPVCSMRSRTSLPGTQTPPMWVLARS